MDDRPRKGTGSRRKLDHETLTKADINKRIQTGLFRLLLDGQQRVTSLYRALKNIDDVWIIIKNDEELPNVRDKNPSDRLLEEVLYEVSGKESADRLSIRLRDVYKMLTGEIVREKNKTALLRDTAYYKSNYDIIDTDLIFEKYLTHTNQIVNILRAEKLLSYYLFNTNEEKFALFFERSNTKGIQLNFIDILCAKLYSGFNLRKKIEDFNQDNPEHLLGQNEIVRAISFIASDGKDIGRKYMLSNLTSVHFNEHWDTLCELYKNCYNYLFDNHLLISQEWIPYESIIIPLLIFIREIPYNKFSQINELQSKFLKYWYWSVIFSERYSVAALGVILEDANILKSVARSNYDFSPNYLDNFLYKVTEYEDLLSYSKKYSSVYRGVLNLINYKSSGIRDWNSNDKITFRNHNLEDHHIFPRKYLQNELKVEEEMIQCVLNRALIPEITNLKYGSNSPSNYLKASFENNTELGNSLKAHLISPKLIQGDLDLKYESFLKNRGNKIIATIKKEILPLKDELKQEIFGTGV